MLAKADTDVRAWTEVGLIAASFFIGPGAKGGQVAATQAAKPIAGVSTRLARVVPRETAEGYVFELVKESGTKLSALQKLRLTVNLPKKGQIRTWIARGTDKSVVIVGGEGVAENAVRPILGFGSKSKGGCFTGFVYDWEGDGEPSNEDYLFTPIVQYKKSVDVLQEDGSKKRIEGTEYQKVYPSAIYVDESFTRVLPDSKEPECELFNPGRERILVQGKEEFVKQYIEKHRADYEGAKVIEDVLDENDKPVLDENGKPLREEREMTAEEIEKSLRNDAEDEYERLSQEDPIVGMDGIPLPGLDRIKPFEFGDMVKQCKFKTHYKGEKINYKVWASPTFPGAGTLNTLSKTNPDGLVDVVDVNGVPIKREDILAFAGDKPSQDNFRFFKDFVNGVADFFSPETRGEGFSNFVGSCATVTLDRELPVQVAGSGDAEQVVKMEVKSDKESYTSGETIVFGGILVIDGEPAGGKDVSIELTQLTDFGPLFKGSETVRTADDGTFSWQTSIQLSADLETDFEVLAKYKTQKSEPYRFTVG